MLNISTDSGAAIEQFEQVFKTDPALAADLLLVANSPLFGHRARIGSIRHAITQLGIDRVRSLGSTIALSFFVRNQPRTAFVRHIWAHSIATAIISETLGNLYGVEDLYTAGLMHDLGRLGLLLTVGQTYEEWVSQKVTNMEAANQSERARFGMNHCEAGSLVGHKWGFPVVLRSCMIAHHGWEAGPTKDPLFLVQLACRIADSIDFPEVHFEGPQAVLDLPGAVRTCSDLSAERVRARVQEQMQIIGH